MGKFSSKLHLPKDVSEEALRLYQQHELKELLVVFEELKNGTPGKQDTSGGLNEEEFEKYFDYPGALRKQIFRVFDRNKDGLIDEGEFIRGLAMCCRGPIDEKMSFVFSMCDLNKDAYVDREELKDVLSSTAFSSFALLQAVALEEGKICEEHAIKTSNDFEEEVNYMVDQAFLSADGNGDNLLSFEEFVKWLLNTPEILNIIYSVFEIRNHVEVAEVKKQLRQRQRSIRHLELTQQEGKGIVDTDELKVDISSMDDQSKEKQVEHLKQQDETLYALIEEIIDKEEAEAEVMTLKTENEAIRERIKELERENAKLKKKEASMSEGKKWLSG